MKKMDKNRYFQIRSRKYTKTKVTDIQRLYSKWLWLVTVVYKPSFPDAEIPDSTINPMTIRNLNISGLRPSNRITTKV